MPFFINGPERFLKAMIRGIVVLIALWGAVMALFPVKPFWIDEWRLIWNIKFKTSGELWGRLDYTQQFPRVFLQLIKGFTASLNYSYFSLRVPSLLISIASMLLCFRLLYRLFERIRFFHFLFVLILISSETFTDYLVQIKQYEMEIFMGLLALWQLLELLKLKNSEPTGMFRYFILNISFLAAPFFAYTYPVAAAPLFFIAFLETFKTLKNKTDSCKRELLRLWFPLLVLLLSIAGFYFLDVSQLMADKSMSRYWQYRMMGGQNNIFSVVQKIWAFFAEVGSGLVYEIIFGVLGLAAFFSQNIKVFKPVRAGTGTKTELIRIYAVSLIWLIIILSLAGKLPVGEPKFNAFSVPAVSLLIIFMLEDIYRKVQWRKFCSGIAVVLFLGLTGNIISTIINTFTAPEYSRRIRIYHQTQKAVRLAQKEKLPIFITPAVAWPDEITRENPFLVTIPADVVLKDWPAYPAQSGVPVYVIDSLEMLPQALKNHPSIRRYVAGNGSDYKVFERE